MNAMVAAAPPRSLAWSVGHVVQFDLRRFRLLCLAMVGLELVRAGFVEATLGALPERLGERFESFRTMELVFVDAIIALATALTTAVMVQGDLPSDDRAFWRSRPIAPLAMAVGKLAVLGLLFVFVPATVNGARLLAYGAPAAAVIAAATQIAVQAAAIVVPAWILALMTRTLPLFVGAAIGLFVATTALLSATAYWLLRLLDVRLRVDRVAQELDWQRIESLGWLPALAISLVALGLLVRHYQHRRWALSIVSAATLLVSSTLLASRDWAPAAAPDLERLVAGRVGVVGILPPATPQTAPETPVPEHDSDPVRILFTLPPLPVDVSAAVSMHGARVNVNGFDLVADAEQCCFSGGPLALVAPAAAERSSEGFYAPAATGSVIATLDRRPAHDTRVSLDGPAVVRFQRHRLAATQPLRVGTTIRVGDQQIDVLAIERRRAVIRVRFLQWPSLFESRQPELSLFTGDPSSPRPSATVPGWAGRQRPVDALVRRGPFGRGRRWAGRFHVLVMDSTVMMPEAQIYLVESREAGTVRSPLAIPEVKPWPARPETPR